MFSPPRPSIAARLLWWSAFLSRVYGFDAFAQPISHRRGLPPIHFCNEQSSGAAIFQHWNDNFFERVSLKSLGLRIQLGHLPGATRVNPKRSSNDDFVDIDSNGIHQVTQDYCACEGAKSAEVQLLRSSHILPVPSHVNEPEVCRPATFRLMKFFHILSFESKRSDLTVDYARHNFKWPNGVGDIQVGKR